MQVDYDTTRVWPPRILSHIHIPAFYASENCRDAGAGASLQLVEDKIAAPASARKPAGAGGQNAMTMKFMTYGMPIMFFFLFYNAPAGLLLYWLTSNVWQVGQQMIINKKMAKDKEAKAVKTTAKPNKTLPPKGKKK